MDKRVIKAAIEKYGYETVNSVIEMADSCGTYKTYIDFVDKGKEKEQECLMALYNLKND